MGHNFKQNSKVIWPGFSSTPLPRQIEKVGRDQPCPCGSGAKYKDCHESEGEVFLEKLARKKHAERVKEERRKLKARGVPWYKRWFVG